MKIPAGFKPFPKGVGFANTIDPLYFRKSDAGVVLGMHVASEHLNGIEICHGGVLMLIADLCCAWNVRTQLPKGMGAPTLSLNFDFINAGQQGDWLEASVSLLEVKRKVGFAAGTICCAEKTVARFNSTFHIAKLDKFSLSGDIADRYANA
nr:putative PaaI family thioesterase [uncultured bacterium]